MIIRNVPTRSAYKGTGETPFSFSAGTSTDRQEHTAPPNVPDVRYIDLLEGNTFRELSAYPETLRQSIKPEEKLIIIDEIQKLPGLLDEAQAMIDRNKSLRSFLRAAAPGN